MPNCENCGKEAKNEAGLKLHQKKCEPELEQLEEELDEVLEEELDGEVDVFDGDTLVRTYTEELHGKDYVKLAKQFAEKKGYKVV